MPISYRIRCAFDKPYQGFFSDHITDEDTAFLRDLIAKGADTNEVMKALARRCIEDTVNDMIKQGACDVEIVLKPEFG